MGRDGKKGKFGGHRGGSKLYVENDDEIALRNGRERQRKPADENDDDSEQENESGEV